MKEKEEMKMCARDAEDEDVGQEENRQRKVGERWRDRDGRKK